MWINKGAHGSKSNVVRDALLIDEDSRSDTYNAVELNRLIELEMEGSVG